MTELHWMPATEMAATIRAGDLDEVEVAEHLSLIHI